jgi:hypothetical protein
MAFQVFLGVFASISYAYFKRFICLHMYVANISSECFKNISGVVLGDPPATVGVRARKVEGARAVSGLVQLQKILQNDPVARFVVI